MEEIILVILIFGSMSILTLVLIASIPIKKALLKHLLKKYEQTKDKETEKQIKYLLNIKGKE